MRDYKRELFLRSEFIKSVLQNSNAEGVILGLSGGKDSALVAILCKHACKNVLGVMMPCESKRNFGEDMQDAISLASQFNIETMTVDLSAAKVSLLSGIKDVSITSAASKNIAPRLRMTTLYALGQSKNYLVAGTGNKSEIYLGYFTKWGDGACDFNPISDLTVKEIYEFLAFLGAPENILTKAPSAGLFDGQTDEKEIGITYKKIDDYILFKNGESADIEKIEKAHRLSAHKRRLPFSFFED